MLADPHQIPTGSKQCACEKLESVVAIGLHKQTFPKSTYRYVLVVTCQNGKQTPIYRKLKDFKWFQDQLDQEVHNCPLPEEASKHLAKQKKKTRTSLITSSMSTTKRIRMIDDINMYLEVVSHYLHDVNQFKALKYFLSPSPKDLEALNWSENDRTFFYYSTLGYCDAMNQSQLTTNLLPVTKFPTQKQNLYRCRSVSLTSQPDHIASFPMLDDDNIYVANEDYVPRDEDASFNVIGLNAGEKVQVLRKSETGWWFVKRINESAKESVGYVPGSFLKPADAILTTLPHGYASIDQDEHIYESIPFSSEYASNFGEKISTEIQLKNKQKNPQNIQRYSDKDRIITSSFSSSEKRESSFFNRHILKLQYLFADKV